MKAAVSLYSFWGYMRETGKSLQECIDIAAGYGCEGVDVIPADFEDDYAKSRAFAKEIGAYLQAAGLKAVCYCTGSDFVRGSDGDVKKEAERVKREVDLAAEYGCPIMRHDATWGGFPPEVKTKRGFDDMLPRFAEGYGIVTEYARTMGIRTCVENHGYVVQDSDRVEKLINAVGNDNFGALVDIGNFCCADEDNGKAVGVLAPYAFHVHVKDFHRKPGREEYPGEGWFHSRGGNYLRGAILGHGDLPVAQCIGILHRAGYDGYLCLEFEGLEDPLKGVRISVDNLKRFIANCK